MRFATILTLIITAGLATFAQAADKTKIVFVAGRPSHAPGDHEHRAGCMLLAKALNENVPDVEAVVTHYGWPRDESIFDGASTVVMYCDGGDNHMANKHLDKVGELMDAGVGLVCIHYAVEYPKNEIGEQFKNWLGGYFEPDWSVNPHWTADYKTLPSHPITSGVSPFANNDEWYFHMRFMPDMKGVTPILSAIAPESTMERGDGPHSGNPDVRKAVADGIPQHMAWTYEREGNNGRSFGFTGGHYHRSWKNDDIRKLMLNAILWTAHVDIPKDGFSSQTPTRDEMKANLDRKNR
ncbi:MAG: ThuA domain-containing protein [Candidatus Hydrogenedentota bacterium]